MAQLITLDEIKQFSPGARLLVKKDTIFTPSAKDFASEKGIKIEYEDHETGACACPKDSLELRREVIDTCLWLERMGLTIGTWGNVSLRLNDGNILITPSKVGYHVMKPEDLVVMAPDGRIVDGFRLPTSERELHRGILNRRPDVNAIVHSHSPYAMACCCIEGGIPPMSEEMAQLIGGGIPLSYRFVPSEKHVELGEVVTDSIGESNAVLIRNHGPVCCGSSLAEAKVCAQVVEKAANMYLHINNDKRIIPIEDKWVKAGRIYFKEGYSKT